MNKIQKIAGIHTLTDAEQSQLIKQVTPYIQGISFKSNIEAAINGNEIVCTWQKSGNKIIIHSVKQVVKDKTDKKNEDNSSLDLLIESGEVIKKNNWFTYKGKNYNGKKAINAAING